MNTSDRDQRHRDTITQLYYGNVFEPICAGKGDVCLVVGNDVCAFFDQSSSRDHVLTAIVAAEEIVRRFEVDGGANVRVKVTCGIHTDNLRLAYVGSRKSCIRRIPMGRAIDVGALLAGPRNSREQEPLILMSESAKAHLKASRILRDITHLDILREPPGVHVFALA